MMSMLPDSTVKDPKKPAKKRKSTDTAVDDIDGLPIRKTKKKNDNKGKKRIKKKIKSQDDDDDGSDMDLSRAMYPIAHYMKHRSEMVRQMFQSLKKQKLMSMMPEILKRYTLTEVEQLCCEQIEVMSKKRIKALISGQRNEDISSSGTEDDLSTNDEADASHRRGTSQPADSTNAEMEGTCCMVDSAVKPLVTLSLSIDDKPACDSNKLELLELELRARAIKRMLESQPTDNDKDSEEAAYVDDQQTDKQLLNSVEEPVETGHIELKGHDRGNNQLPKYHLESSRELNLTDNLKQNLHNEQSVNNSLSEEDNEERNDEPLCDQPSDNLREASENVKSSEAIDDIIPSDHCDGNVSQPLVEHMAELPVKVCSSSEVLDIIIDQDDTLSESGHEESEQVENGQSGMHVLTTPNIQANVAREVDADDRSKMHLPRCRSSTPEITAQRYRQNVNYYLSDDHREKSSKHRPMKTRSTHSRNGVKSRDRRHERRRSDEYERQRHYQYRQSYDTVNRREGNTSYRTVSTDRDSSNSSRRITNIRHCKHNRSRSASPYHTKSSLSRADNQSNSRKKFSHTAHSRHDRHSISSHSSSAGVLRSEKDNSTVKLRSTSSKSGMQLPDSEITWQRKSPVRFPSPDIEIIEVPPRPAPFVVVLSDSD